MSGLEKRKFIKDPVWGNVEFFPWEQRLLNHFLVNRLHHIVQNSSAFKVYPGLKYSRFIHTIGVVHVVTQLFLNAAVPEDEAVKAVLLSDAEKVRKCVDSNAAASIEAYIVRSWACPKEAVILLAALRIAALAHDIGHLPYSHVFENALDEFTQGSFASAIPLSESAKAARDKLIGALKPHREDDCEDVKFHEVLGSMFLEVLMDSYSKDNEVAGLLKAASEILHGKDMPTAHGFIAGTIDADRIDFVRRDGLFSGLFTSSVDFGRLFSSYELAFDDATKAWLPRPSHRATSEKEKLLLERFQDYKYIVVHHRVHLYDEIMQNILLRMMASGALNDFLEVLTNLVNFNHGRKQNLHDKGDHIEMLRKLLTNFDDPWVELEIRKQYESKALDNTARRLFDAYVEERNVFVSGFKTDEDFIKICGKYAPNLAASEPNSVRFALAASKHMLQDKLSAKLKRIVLVGTTDKKLNFGISDGSTAKFFGVADLREFLAQKKGRSPTFNVWYESSQTDGSKRAMEHESVMKDVLEFLQELVTGQLELPQLTPPSKGV